MGWLSRAGILVLSSVITANALTPNAFRRPRLVKQISADPFGGAGGSEADTQVEPHIAVHPIDPSNVVAVFQQGRFDAGGSVDPGYATSRDGGRTWTAGNLPGLTVAVGGPFERASDPVVAFGRDGAVYAQTLGFDLASDCRSAVAVQRSDDGGITFNAPVLVQDDSPCSLINDKNWIAVDTFPGSPHYGRVYSAWDRIDLSIPNAPQLLRYSDDRGATWSGLVTVSDASPLSFTIGANPVVQPNGDVTIVYNAYFPQPTLVVSQTSHDGGDHFDPAVTIGTYEGSAVPGMRTAGDDGSVLPAAAADPVTGNLYAVWQDGRFRSDGLNDIVVSVSTDGGLSWGALGVVNDPGPALNHFTAAVASYASTVLVSYGTREDQDNKVRMRYAVSADDGASFGRERRLGGSGNLDFAATASGGLLFLGDYIGLALSANAAHAVWCRPTRSGASSAQHQTTWSATIPR
jgi:hypothetical protein